MATGHTDLINSILLALSKTGKITAWRNETGTARSMDGHRIIRFGLKGSSDIIGIADSGRFIAIECKLGRDQLREEQINFRRMISGRNGVYIEARSIDDVMSELEKEQVI